MSFPECNQLRLRRNGDGIYLLAAQHDGRCRVDVKAWRLK